MPGYAGWRALLAGVALGAPLMLSAPARAQDRPEARAVALEDAIRAAELHSEQVAIAQSAVLRSRGEAYRARSEYFPQIFGSAGYTRTLRTEFSAVTEPQDTSANGGGHEEPAEECGTFTPNPLLPLAERVDSLEAAVRCAANASPFAAFGSLPFGRPNQWNLGLSLNQSVFSGGRVQAQNRIARSGRTVAEIGLRSTRAQLVLDVTQAYYDAALTDRLVAIAEATLEQAETTLVQAQIAREVGDQPEFELLRAQVTRDNQRPVLIQRRSDRDLAYMRLKQLMDTPMDTPIRLVSDLDEEAIGKWAAQVTGLLTTGDTTTAARAPVRQAAEAVAVQENLARIARAQRFPGVSLASQFGRVAYPSGGIPVWSDFRSNWTIAVSMQLPIFTGGRIRGDEMVAAANVTDARARLDQTRELAVLDTRSAIERLQAAEASWRSSAGTVQQATRAYSIAELRYKEGISTQVELSDSRILLQQAQANRALAARDLQVARVRLELLPDLPLGTAGSGAAAAGQSGSSAVPQQQQQPQPRQQAPAQRGGTLTTTQASTVGTP